MKRYCIPAACMAATLAGNACASPGNIVSFAGHEWRVEAQVSTPRSTVTAKAGTLNLDAAGGVTVLLLTPLTGTYCIRYTRQVLPAEGGVYRISDLNQFWLIDPAPLGAPEPRDGRLESYTPDRLFYVGIGGNNNTTTRFRHYDGSPARPLLGEADLRLEANRRYDLRTCVLADRTELYVDGKLLFSAAQTPPRLSYFALRSVGSKQRVTHFRIEQR
jgi:hypothetical protein